MGKDALGCGDVGTGAWMGLQGGVRLAAFSLCVCLSSLSPVSLSSLGLNGSSSICILGRGCSWA